MVWKNFNCLTLILFFISCTIFLPGKHKKYVWEKGWKENLDEFHLAYIGHCFETALEENMGLMNEVGQYNYDLFQEFKAHYIENIYFVDFDNSKNKKSAA